MTGKGSGRTPTLPPNPHPERLAAIMAASTATASELTREQVARILTKPLEQASRFLAAGPRIFDTDGSPVRIPTEPAFDYSETDGETGGDKSVHALPFTGENELIPEADFAPDELVLLPSTMKSVKVITRYSNELARQSIVALEPTLRGRLVADVAARMDAQFLSASDGSGGTEPRGIFDYAGQTLPAAGPLTLDHLHDAEGMALAANADPSRMVWFIRPEQLTELRKVRSATGSNTYALQPDATAASGYTLLGRRAIVSAHVPEGYAALADMSQIAVARDMAPSVKVLTERYADYDQQAIRVVSRYDAGPLNANAVIAVTGITDDDGE